MGMFENLLEEFSGTLDMGIHVGRKKVARLVFKKNIFYVEIHDLLEAGKLFLKNPKFFTSFLESMRRRSYRVIIRYGSVKVKYPV
ncbi:MAG: hypothetical protein DRP11_02615 [Candidatus Aenigmatarchaeota archaeon]|nr:MAG: hypothetical protein DRP11_02615 [Candidatus Aenigmarchaeota archaeon]